MAYELLLQSRKINWMGGPNMPGGGGEGGTGV